MKKTVNNSDRLETTIQRFENPDTHAVVDVIGMIHVGEPQYYDRIQGELEGRDDDGFKIHYELINRDEDPVGGDSVAMRAKLFMAEHGADVMGALLDGMGLVHQIGSIDLRASWENHDASLQEYYGRRSLPGIATSSVVSHVAAWGLRKIPAKKRVESMISSLEDVEVAVLKKRNIRHPINSAEVREIRRAVGLEERTWILNYRNTIALDAMRSELANNPEQNITLMWGEAHLLGLAAGITACGYRHEGDERITAITYENMRAAARDSSDK